MEREYERILAGRHALIWYGTIDSFGIGLARGPECGQVHGDHSDLCGGRDQQPLVDCGYISRYVHGGFLGGFAPSHHV